jgi:threonine dehydratase
VLVSVAITIATGGLYSGVLGWLAAILLPVIVFFVAVVARSSGASAFERDQRLKRIDFDTKLGMHSPR